MSTANAMTENEVADAKKVNNALQALERGDDTTAEALLLDVIQRTPRTYVYQSEDAGGLVIKFWDRSEFMHYIVWTKDHGAAKPIKWAPSAYPRAYFHLGFLKVKTEQYAAAIELLDRGSALEPTNPKFKVEKAMALVQMHRFDEALALYQSVNEVGPHVCPDHVARAWRGRGGIYIELGQLDRAEAAFRESLKIAPGNELAINELVYIAQLREGGQASPINLTASSDSSADKCAICGKPFTQGQLTTINGRSAFVCQSCHRTNTQSKKWWEIWK